MVEVYRANFQVWTNSDWVQPFVLQIYNPKTRSAIPYDLSGAVITMRWWDDSQNTIITVTNLDNSIVVTNEALGQFQIQVMAETIDPATPTTRNLPIGVFQGDGLVSNSGTNDLIIESTLTVSAGITVPLP